MNGLPEGVAGAESAFRGLLKDHLGVDPVELPVLTEQFEPWQHVVVQFGLNSYLADRGRSHKTVGLIGGAPSGGLFPTDPPLSQVIAQGSMLAGSFQVGAPEHVNLPSGIDESIQCVRKAMMLVSGPGGPLAVYVRQEGYPLRRLCFDILAPEADMASSFISALKDRMARTSPYKGHVLRLGIDESQYLAVGFAERPTFKDEEVVLPPGVLERIEEHSVGIGLQRRRLLAAKIHLKRGLLLWGPPGTGKTHTIKYLLSRLKDYTVIEMVGSQMGFVSIAGALARSLAPAVIILEDVDLIAEDRSHPGQAPRRFLFDLLDMLDGLDDDADIVSVLTTNRPEMLESAIAARPGRIDRAVEIPLPDAEGRRRLVELYGRGFEIKVQDMDAVLARTEGVSASFIKEMLRQAALKAPKDGSITVTDSELAEVLDTLLDPSNPLTRALLGGRIEIAPAASAALDRHAVPGPDPRPKARPITEA